MIPRYTRSQMGRIFTDEHRWSVMLQIEILAAEAWAHLGRVPRQAIKKIKEKARINIPRIIEIEQTVKHDVIAFLTQVGETIGPESRFLHIGMTSSDVLDTGLAVQMQQAADLLLQDCDQLITTLAKLARRYRSTMIMGRSHGIHAEPTTFGLKAALWYAETVRNRERLIRARAAVSVGKISGAVGTYAHLDPRIEAHICKKLGLQPAYVSTQIIQRDRHAEFCCALAVVAGTCEKIATEIRHLQRTEVAEAEEPFTPGQKGSSAMPHKRNPILSENICGLARIVRSNALTSLENIALWHERDISHSSAERIIIPDTCILLDFMLNRLNGVLKKLAVYPQTMKANIQKTASIIVSQRLMLMLVDKGMKREDAYRIIQTHAMKARTDQAGYKKNILGDKKVTSLASAKEISGCFDLKYYIRWVDEIYKKVGL
ncbi:MAG: adenylosuccinate lyase [Elusimicrobia bacterium]|nr:adenylosuccinate lyase [Elusimicrobiota bacterium]MBD3412379.1 adenylosuccinate lyase [Elusimicrobiota bacterium]